MIWQALQVKKATVNGREEPDAIQMGSNNMVMGVTTTGLETIATLLHGPLFLAKWDDISISRASML